MFYFKVVENNELVRIGTNSLCVPPRTIEITETEYNTILAEIEAQRKQEEPTTDPTIDSIISEVANSGY